MRKTVWIPVERHASGWMIFRSGDEEAADPVEAVEAQRERRHAQVRGEQ